MAQIASAVNGHGFIIEYVTEITEVPPAEIAETRQVL
jgi:hypothetical protein